MADRRKPDRWRLAVLLVIVLAVGSGPVAAAVQAPPMQAQQVDVTVSTFGGGLTLGGNVSGDATGVAGDFGASASAGGNLTVVLGGQPFAGTVAADVTLDGDLGAVFDTGVVRWELLAELRGLDRTLSFVRNGTVAAGAPLAPAADREPADSERAAVLAGTFLPAQAAAGDWIDVTFWELYGFLVNLLLGIVLVGVFPTFSRRVATGITDDALTTGVTGLAVLVAVPLVLLLVALSLFGLPLALVGALLLLVLSWVGSLYGRFAVGVWLLDVVPRSLAAVGTERGPVENRWAALFVGLVVVALLIQVPYVGRVVDVVVVALGVGALARLVYAGYRRTERVTDAGTTRSREEK